MSPWFMLIDSVFVPVWRSIVTTFAFILEAILIYFELPWYIEYAIVPGCYLIFVVPFYLIDLDEQFW